MKGIIYKATNTFNGTVYIGQTITGLPNRKKQHYKDARGDESNAFHIALYQYPKAFEWGIIDEFSGTREEVLHALNVAEEYHIIKHDSMKNGYNSTMGGYSSNKFSDAIKRRAKEKGGAKQILQYDIYGNFVQEFGSISAAAAYLGKEKLRLSVLTYGLHYGYQWRIKTNEYFPKTIAPYTQKIKQSNKIIAYKADGTFFGSYDSIKDAHSATGVDGWVRDFQQVVSVQEWNIKPVYFFIKPDGDYPKAIKFSIIKKKTTKKTKPTQPCKCYAYDAKTGLFVKEYDSISAAIVSGSDKNSIRKYAMEKEPISIKSPHTKYVWRIGEPAANGKLEVIPFVKKEYIPKTKDHRVIQYSLNGVFIKIWDNQYKAAISGEESAAFIRKQVFGIKPKHQPKYQWRKYTPNYPLKIEPYNNRKNADVCETLRLDY